MDLIRLLFVSDTHIGFDAPRRARVDRRRRGPDFLRNFERALAPARRGEVDAVIHGGDLLYRSRVPAALTAEALSPLKAVADLGIPVLLVPGNHERSRIPHPLLAVHENLHVFDRPKTVALDLQGVRVAVAGFPYTRRIRTRFPEVLEATRWRERRGDVTLLAMHHAVEGARVGHPEFVFREGHDVVRTRDLPSGIAAVLSGHIHRAQALTRDLRGRELPAPVLYAGSVERTSFAERLERKGYLTVALTRAGRLHGWRFHELPTRPMARIAIDAGRMGGDGAERYLEARLQTLPRDSVVQLAVTGAPPPGWTAAKLRALAPPTMNLSWSAPRSELSGERSPRPS